MTASLDKFIGIFIWLSVCCVPDSIGAQTVNMDSILSVLDTCVMYRKVYEGRYLRHLDSLRTEIGRTTDPVLKMRLWIDIGLKEYSHQSGEALKAFNEALACARRLGDSQTERRVVEMKAGLFGELGMPWESERLLKPLLAQSDLSLSERKRLLKTYNGVYDYFRTGRLPEEISDRQLAYISAYEDSLRMIMGSAVDQCMAFDYSSTNVQNMIHTMKLYLDTVSEPIKGVAAVVLANKYYLQGDAESRDYYWALAAVYNIRYCCYEHEPLIRISSRLFEKGDTERAIRYMLAAYDNAEIYGTNVRKAELAPLLAQGLRQKKEECDSGKRRVQTCWVIVLVLAMMFLVVVGLYASALRKIKYLSRVAADSQEKEQRRYEVLKADVEVKNEYVSRFLELSLDAVYEVEQLRNTVLIRLKARDVDRLVKMMSDPQRSEAFRKECLKRFDFAFFRMYPDFIQSVNRLLQPDKQIELPSTELMNNELRILAFLRLGITDGAKIAIILGISVNTIYFYRNRLRRHAVDRDNFEKQIARL